MEKFNFENLEVYNKALDFANSIYDVTVNFPRNERFALVDQFRRAAISIALNIAEGYGNSDIGFKRYLRIAKGSTRECAAIISISKMRKYINSETELELRNRCGEISRMLSGLIRRLNKNEG